MGMTLEACGHLAETRSEFGTGIEISETLF
jgi:hypothetical protein